MKTKFQFAGFSFPRGIATIDTRPARVRLADRKRHGAGGYYHAPTPGHVEGWSTYHESDRIMGLRFENAGEAWYCDEFQDATMQGIVLRLPNNRGFLVGWTMGKGMLCSVDSDRFYDERNAQRCAESRAESAAEREREYQEAEARRLDEEMQDEAQEMRAFSEGA